MLIEQAIKKELMDASGVTDLISTRLYYVRAPQDVTKPYVVFFKVSGPREYSHDGASELANPRFQFSCFATTYYEAKQIVTAIRTVLEGFDGMMGGDGGVSVGGCFCVNETDIYEDDTDLFHVAVDYLIWHEE
jgi:hypothetical protein